jgi:hypothetical protein
MLEGIDYFTIIFDRLLPNRDEWLTVMNGWRFELVFAYILR